MDGIAAVCASLRIQTSLLKLPPPEEVDRERARSVAGKYVDDDGAVISSTLVCPVLEMSRREIWTSIVVDGVS